MTRPTMYAGLLLVIAIVYGRSLDDPFHFDDMHSIRDNGNLASLRNVPRYFTDPGTFSADSSLTMYRPVLLTSFALNHAASGLDTWSYHLVNVAVHGAVAIAIVDWLLLLGLQPLVALLGALLFALHPAHSEAVYYISSRSESLAALCVLVALVLHRLAGQGAQPAGRRQRALWSTGAALAFALGLLSKSIAIAFVPLALLADVLLQRQSGHSATAFWRHHWRRYGAYAVIASAYLVFTRDLITRATVSAPVRPLAEQFWSQVKGVAYYLQLLVVPRGLSIDHQFQISTGPDVYAASAGLLMLSLLWLAIVEGRRRPLAGLLALWFVVALAPASAVPLNVIVNEHRMYLSGVAFASGIVCLVPRSGGRVLAMRCLWLVVAVLATLSFQRGSAWDSETSIWQDALRKAPDMARPRFVLAELRVAEGHTEEAAELLVSGLRRDPQFVPAYRRLAQLRLATADLTAALQVADEAVRRAPDTAAAWALLAEVSREHALASVDAPDDIPDGIAGDAISRVWFERSAEAYRQALRLAPEMAAWHSNLGNTLEVLDQPEDALVHHRKAVQLSPGNASARLNLGNVLRALGRRQESETAYLQAVELDSVYVDAWLNLASLYEQGGATDLAAEARRRASRAGAR